VVKLEVVLLSPAGKIPRVDPELEQMLKKLPKDAPIEKVVEIIESYRPKSKAYTRVSEPEGLYRLTI